MLIQKRIKVSIRWCRPEEGGRCFSLPGYHYRPTIIIPKRHDSVEHWSFFIDCYSLPEYDQPTIAEGVFIMVDFSEDVVPWSYMTEGTDFFVMEGPKKVGFGKVIEGIEAADTIVNVKRNFSDRPVEDVVIKKVTMEE